MGIFKGNSVSAGIFLYKGMPVLNRGECTIHIQIVVA